MTAEKNRTFVLGDCHGNYKALKQCLERSNFDYEEDLLIQIGDVVDGFLDTYRCVEELLKIKNLIAILGNHDEWFRTYIETGIHPVKWTSGGIHTAQSYLAEIGKPDHWQPTGSGYVVALNPADIPIKHQEFFKKQLLYYIDDDNNCFVHGGFNRHFPFKEQAEYVYYWDRDLWMSALSYGTMNKSDSMEGKGPFKTKTKFNEIFIGHTATTNWDEHEKQYNEGDLIFIQKPRTTPMHAANIWNIDTGAGENDGKLTIMNVSTKEFYQSDVASTLYPDFKPR